MSAVTANRGGERLTDAAASAPRTLWDRRATRIIGGLILPLLILALWQAVTVSGLIPPYRLPPPATVLDAAVQLAQSGDLWIHVAISLQRVVLGFAIGSVVGLAVAAIVGLTRAGDILLSPSLAAVRAIPSLALVPLLLLWMGIGEDSKVTLIAIGAFFPVFTTVSAALRQVDPHAVEMARSFSLRGFDLFRTVQLPAVVPSIMSGLRLGLAQAWRTLVGVEMLASVPWGLGWMIFGAREFLNTDVMLSGVFVIGVLGLLLEKLVFQKLEEFTVMRWGMMK